MSFIVCDLVRVGKSTPKQVAICQESIESIEPMTPDACTIRMKSGAEHKVAQAFDVVMNLLRGPDFSGPFRT